MIFIISNILIGKVERTHQKKKERERDRAFQQNHGNPLANFSPFYHKISKLKSNLRSKIGYSWSSRCGARAWDTGGRFNPWPGTAG